MFVAAVDVGVGAGGGDPAVVVDGVGVVDGPAGAGNQQGVEIQHGAVLIEKRVFGGARIGQADDLPTGVDAFGGAVSGRAGITPQFLVGHGPPWREWGRTM